MPLSPNATDGPGWRYAFVDAAAFSALALVAITELLSVFNALTRTGVLVAWGVVALALSGRFLRNHARPALITSARIPELTREDRYYLAFLAFISLVTLYVAIAGLPNAADSHTYHLPRVLRWIQDGTVAFYPTHIPRQLWIGPGWEFYQLHLQLIVGTDAGANLVQWLAMVASPVVASLGARELGAGRRGQLLAALFTLSIPMGIAQASGSQVDLFSGFWLATSIALLLRIRRQRIGGTTLGTAILLGAAAGMAALSKATNFLFLFPFVLWVAAGLLKAPRWRFLTLAVVAAAMALAVNAGHMSRNAALYGQVTGVRGNAGVMNETFNPGSLASNIVRNAAMQLNTPSDAANAMITRAITRMHALVGMDVHDPRTTYSKRFDVPAEWDDEGQGSNQLHLLIIIAAGIWLTLRNRASPATPFIWCVLAGALLFCFFLKWQPWHSRLHLPLFMISGAAIGAGLERALSPNRLRWVAVALALTALHPTFRNNMRPLVVRRPLFTVPYEERLFTANHPEWKVYAEAATAVASLGCSRIGIIETSNTWEYPVWKLMERRTGTRPEIRHVGVTDESRRTASHRDRDFDPCVIMNIQSVFPGDRELPGILRMHSGGVPQIPPGFEPAWKRDFITLYTPAGL